MIHYDMNENNNEKINIIVELCMKRNTALIYLRNLSE